MAQLSRIEAESLVRAVAKYQAAPDEQTRMDAMMEYDTYYEQRCNVLDTELRQLEQTKKPIKEQIQHAENELESLRAQVRKLQKRKKKHLHQEKNLKKSAAGVSCAGYFDFLKKRAMVVAKLKSMHAALTGFTANAHRVEGPWYGQVLLTPLRWDHECTKMERKLAALDKAAAAISDTLEEPDSSTEEAHALWKAVVEAYPLATNAVSEATARANATRDAKNEIDVERKRLLTWCRQQKTNLDTVVDPNDTQEFCASLLSNFPTMEENFTVLLEMVEPLLPDESLQKVLLECNEVWLNLQVATYDRLRHTLLEIHPKSKLEDEVREFSSFSARVGEFLESFSDLLAGPSDPESQDYVQPVVERCDALREEYGAHRGLTKQLHDFSFRMECLRESYMNLRRAVLSRLTFLSSAVPALTASMRRKEEYVARMKDLKRWVEVKSQGETWKDIHARIQSMKLLIEAEQAALQEAKELK